MAIDFTDAGAPKIPAEHREPMIITYYKDASGKRSSDGSCPDDFYQYIYRMARGGVGGRPVPGVDIEELGDPNNGGRFLKVLLSRPLIGYNTATGASLTVLGAMLHEEVYAGSILVEGWLGSDHATISANWDEFVRPDPEHASEVGDIAHYLGSMLAASEARSDLDAHCDTERFKPGDSFLPPTNWLDEARSAGEDEHGDDCLGEDQ